MVFVHISPAISFETTVHFSGNKRHSPPQISLDDTTVSTAGLDVVYPTRYCIYKEGYVLAQSNLEE
jgi:hypothetical protein